MPENAKAKRDARARQKRTGEGYTTARAHTKHKESGGPTPPITPTRRGSSFLHVRGYELRHATGYLIGEGSLRERLYRVNEYYLLDHRHPRFEYLESVPPKRREELELEFQSWRKDTREVLSAPSPGPTTTTEMERKLESLANRLFDIYDEVVRHAE